nr:chemotaxis protein CheX [Candidatus Krumholzibacteria bacterium]
MIIARRSRGVEDPTDLMTKMEALKEAVDAAIQTFDVQFGMEMVPDGMPGTPDPTDVLYGSTIALTNTQINYQFACVFPEQTAKGLTRVLFGMEEDEDPPMEDMGDALNELPNVAAGVWKAMREKSAGEQYQLGLPIFLKGNSWITYFPRKVNAVAQKLKGPDGIVLQVILIWCYNENAGGCQLMTTHTDDITAVKGNSVPAQVLKEAVKAVVDTCSIQMDLNLEVQDNPTDPRQADVEYGSSIALTAENGGWNLAVMANKPGCEELTRALFAMESDEHPEMEDMADAIGEIANVAAGVLKASRAKAGQACQLGLPLFLEGKSCIEFFASGIQGMAQTVSGPNGLEAHVIIIWQEG